MNNVISYATPAFGGFSVHAMYSNSGTGNTSNDLDKWSKNGHYYGIGVKLEMPNMASTMVWNGILAQSLRCSGTSMYGRTKVTKTTNSV